MSAPSSPQALIDALEQEFNALATSDPMFFVRGFDITKCTVTATILALPREEQVGMVRAVMDRQVEAIKNRRGSLELKAILAALLRKKLPFTLDDLEALVNSVAGVQNTGWLEAVSPVTILRLAEEHVTAHGMTANLRQTLERFAITLRDEARYAAIAAKLLKQVDAMLQGLPPPASDGTPVIRPIGKPTVKLTTGEPWVVQLRAQLERFDEPARQAWEELLLLCQQATSSKPTAKWLKQAQAHVTALEASFAETAVTVFGEVGKPGTAEEAPANALGYISDPTQVHSVHSDLVRGLIWAASLSANENLPTALGDMAEICFRKLPGIGPRSPKIGNACLWALANMSTQSAVAQLGRIKSKAKHVSVQKQLGKAMDNAAEKTGLSPADLEEVAVPTFGLTAVGECRQPLGAHTALLTIHDSDVELTWLKEDGKAQATVPAVVKENFPEDVKLLKKNEKTWPSNCPPSAPAWNGCLPRSEPGRWPTGKPASSTTSSSALWPAA